jgi:hypothetical protein
MGNLFFFHWQHKGSKKRQSRPKQSIPQIFKTVVVLSVITKTPLGTPSASTAIHNVPIACDKGYKFARHQYFTLKKLYKNST